MEKHYNKQEIIRIIKRCCIERKHIHAIAKEEKIEVNVLGVWIHKHLESVKDGLYERTVSFN